MRDQQSVLLYDISLVFTCPVLGLLSCWLLRQLFCCCSATTSATVMLLALCFILFCYYSLYSACCPSVKELEGNEGWRLCNVCIAMPLPQWHKLGACKGKPRLVLSLLLTTLDALDPWAWCNVYILLSPFRMLFSYLQLLLLFVSD